MQRAIVAFGIAAVMAAGTAGVSAQRGHGPKAQAPKAQGPKSQAPKVQGPKAQGPKTHGAPTVHGGSTHGTATKTQKVKAGRPVSSAGTLSPVQQKLQRNTNLASKMSGRLPAGSDLMTASSGFRNLGQFVAAVNVSNNLGIPFATLKSRMVDDGMSLGQAIQDLRPRADYLHEVRRAEQDAAVMIGPDDGVVTTAGKAKRRPGGQ